jgi:chemotaxis response regulator CheB
MSPVRVVVVDDSPTMRGLIGALLRRDPEIDVVGFAGDPYQARQTIKELNPDVITLDIEMPNMNGLEFLERIMRLRPMPVVMVSTLTQAGARRGGLRRKVIEHHRRQDRPRRTGREGEDGGRGSCPALLDTNAAAASD